MHIRLGDLVSLIIREKFGPIIEKVACVLQKYGTLTLNQIRTNADLPISKVRGALTMLIKYRLVTFKPCAYNKKIAEYELCEGNVVMMLRYGKYTILIKEKFGDLKSEIIIEELLRNGYMSASRTILNVAERLQCDVSQLSVIRDYFVALVVAKYVEKVELKSDRQPVPILETPDEKLVVPPSVNIHLLSQIYLKKINETVLPQVDVFYTVNFDRFHQDMRDNLIVTAFTRKIDESAGEFVRILLQQMYIRTNPWDESSNPVPLSEIKSFASKKVNCSNLLAFFDEYVEIIEQDIHNIIVRAGEANGSSLQIHLKKAFTAFTWELIGEIISQRFGTKAARIFRIVKEKEYIDADQLQRLAMIPSRDAKRISYQLVQGKFLKLKEFKKPSVNNGPVTSAMLFYVDLHTVVENEYSLCYKAIYNMMAKKNHLHEVNKRLLEKKRRCDAIVNMMKDQNASAEQISEFEENVTPAEREIVAKIERQVKKLDSTILEIDSTIFVLEVYLKHTCSRALYN